MAEMVFAIIWAGAVGGCFALSLWVYVRPLQSQRLLFRVSGLGWRLTGVTEEKIVQHLRDVADESKTLPAVRALWSTPLLSARLFGGSISLADQAAMMEFLLNNQDDETSDGRGAEAWRKYRVVIRRIALLMMIVSAGLFLIFPITALVVFAWRGLS